MPDAFDDLSATYAARPPRRSLRLPPGWRDPDDELDALNELDTFTREPSVLDDLRGGLFDPDKDEIEFFQDLQDYSPPAREPSRFDRAVRHVFEAPEFIRKPAREFANWIEGDPTLEDVDRAESSDIGFGGILNRPARSFIAGGLAGKSRAGGEGLAELANPFDVATSLTGLSAIRSARRLSNSLEALQAGGSAFMTGAGLERGRRAFVENRPEDYGQAAFETGMGAAGIAAGAHGYQGPAAEPVLRGNVLHPEGWRPPSTDIGPRRRPQGPPDLEAEFWSDEGPNGPQGPTGPGGGYLPDPYAPRAGDVVPDESVGAFPYRNPPALPPAPQPQLPAARRFYGRGESMFDVGEGFEQADELEAFLSGAEPRFYQGSRGVADVLDRPQRTRVMGPTADMGPDYALWDDRNEAVVFPPEVAAERGVYPEASRPVGRLQGMPLIGDDEPGAAGWRGTGVDRPGPLARQPRQQTAAQGGLNELADFLGEGAPPPRQQADIRSDLFDEPTGGNVSEPDAVTPDQATEATEIAPRKRGPLDLAGLDPRVLREIGRMVVEMEEGAYDAGSMQYAPDLPVDDPFINRPNVRGGAHYTPASPEAPIVKTFQGLGTWASRADIARRLRRALTKGQSDPLFDMAQQIAEARLAGKGSVTHPAGVPVAIGQMFTDPAAGEWALPESARAPSEVETWLNQAPVTPEEVAAANLDPDLVDRWSRGFVPDTEMRAAIEDANAADVGSFFEAQGGGRSDADVVDELARELGVSGEASLVDDVTDLNASGESAASAEALSRQAGMQARGEQFVVYDRAGNKRVLVGPDSVDYQVRPGEMYGVETREGFRLLEDAGGRLPRGAVVQDVREALRGPKDRVGGMHPNELEAMDLVDEILGDYEPEAGGYNQGRGELPGAGAAPRRRRLEDMLPEGYLDDPATQEWLARLEAGEVPERRGGGVLDDILSTGEVQPRLGGVEGVRDMDVATPEIADAPYALSPEAFEEPGVQPRLEDIVDVEGDRWPETRHEVRAPEKVEEIAQSMARVGWQGRPALILRTPTGDVAWTATHRLEAAKRAGLSYQDVPKIEIDAAQLAAAGFDVDALTQLGKKARIKALIEAGLTDAADLLEAERRGSPERTQAAASGVPEDVPDNVADFLFKQLKYSRAEIAAMGPAEAVRVGKERIVNPNAPAPRVPPEEVLGRLLESDPELAGSYERNVERMLRQSATRNLQQQGRRVPRRDVYTGGLEQEANLPARESGLPQRQAPPEGLEAEDLITAGLRERPRVERAESDLTAQEREARGLAPIEKPALTKAEKSAAQSTARGKQTAMVHRAREMTRLINNPSPANLDEYVRLLGEQHASQTKREVTGGTTTEAPKRYRETGEYLASGLGGLEKLYRENPSAFWTLMRSGGGALLGALIDDEDPLRGAAMGAVLSGVAPSAFSRLRTILRTGKIKPPKASDKDISWWRMISPSPERTVPEVFAHAQESFRELERLYADPTRSQSSNIAAKQIYLSDLARDIRELSVEAREKGHKRKSWYLNSLANAVAGVPTVGQRKVQEVGSRVLEGLGFSARTAAEPLHAAVSASFTDGRTVIQDAIDELDKAKQAHAANVKTLRPDSSVREQSRRGVEDARTAVGKAMRDTGQQLRDAADTIDVQVGRSSKPGQVNQARRAREVGRKIQNYKSAKQALAAIDRLETELGQGALRVKPDVVESTVSKVVYRTLIGYAMDTALQNLSQPVLTTLFVKPRSLMQGYRYARTAKGRALAKEIELHSLVDDESAAVDDRPLREISRTSGKGAAAKALVTDSSRPLRVTDNYNRRVSYLAALDHKGALKGALQTGKVPEAADEFAREVVRKTQGHTGPLGNNPFQRGPIGGSLKPFTKYPGLFLENVVDALNDPKARGRAAVVALLGAVLAAKASGLDFEDMLVSGGRPFGIDLTQPGSLRPDRLARATPLGRGVSDVVGHVSDVAGGERMSHDVVGRDLDSFLNSDLAYMVFGRYPTKVAQKGLEFSREGFGQHQGLRPSGEADPHPASEDLADLVGVRSTRTVEQRRRNREAQEAVNRSRRSREDAGAEARRLATIAIQRGDNVGLQTALGMMTPGQRQAFLRTLGRTRTQRLEQQLPRGERQQFRDEFGGDELEQFLESR